MNVISRCLLRRILALLFSWVIIAVISMTSSSALSAPPTWENVDPTKVGAFPTDIRGVSPEVLLNLQNAYSSARAKAESAKVALELDRGRNEWYALLKQLDAELAAVAERARKDEQLRAVATFFRLMSATANFANSLAASTVESPTKAPPRNEGTVLGLPPTGLEDSPEGSVLTQQTFTQTMSIRKDGKWWAFDHREYIYRHIDTRAAIGGKGAFGSIDPMISILDEFGGILTDGQYIDCYSAWGGCISAPKADEQEPVTRSLELSERSPTESEKELYKVVLSFSADLVPFVGQAKSVAELITGNDPITGEAVNRAFAAMGIVPGGKAIAASTKGMRSIFRALDRANFGRAREFVAAAIRNWRFGWHALGRGSGDYPIAVLNADQAVRIGAMSRVVRLSQETATAKALPERLGGRGLEAENYRWLQEFLDHGEVIDLTGLSESGVKRHFGILGKKNEDLWYGVIKATDDDGMKVYLKSLRRTDEKDIERLRRGQ